MKLSEIFEQLSHGELSQLYMGGAETQGVSVEHYHQLTNHVNLGLAALFQRFNLKEGTATIPLDPATRQYSMRGMDALKIERVYLPDKTELPLNDQGKDWSCSTPTLLDLVVPEGLEAEFGVTEVVVVYRAKHPEIDKEEAAFDPEMVEVDLPYSHLQALLYFIASRIMNPISPQGEYHAGNNYAAKYEQACRVLENQGLQVRQEADKDRFTANGWV